jgi:hypothetical protein
LGRQEDAHEYLRCVLDAMHEAFLKHIKPKPPPELASTTFIHRIFGGKLRSEVSGCHHRLNQCALFVGQGPSAFRLDLPIIHGTQ